MTMAEILVGVGRAGFGGVNLTIPHKTAALPLLHAVDPHAAHLGAVNTVRVEADGTLRGFNTDGPGFVRAVRAEFDLTLRGSSVLILGAAGGAGRALAAQCMLEGCRRVILVNRTFEKARELAEKLGASAVPWEEAAGALDGVDLLVNASSVGLHAGDVSPLPATAIPAGTLVFDTVYRASGEPTPLLTAAHEARARTAGGLALLLHQGALSFEHWFGVPAPLEAMRRGMAYTASQVG